MKYYVKKNNRYLDLTNTFGKWVPRPYAMPFKTFFAAEVWAKEERAKVVCDMEEVIQEQTR